MTQIGLALKSVPEDKKTPEICELAVEANAYAISYVPADMVTDKIAQIMSGRMGEIGVKYRANPDIMRELRSYLERQGES